jgi:hypothetical protein
VTGQKMSADPATGQRRSAAFRVQLACRADPADCIDSQCSLTSTDQSVLLHDGFKIANLALH